MKIGAYLKSKIIYIFVFIFFLSIVFIFFLLFNFEVSYFLFYMSGFVIAFILFLIVNYIHLYINFNKMQKSIKDMDKPQFILYNYKKPTDFESLIIYNMIKEVNDKIYLKYKQEIDKQENYKDYIELWIHEIKIPVQNIKNETEQYNNKKLKKEIDHLDFLINKILNISKVNFDNIVFLVNQIDSKALINEVIKENFNTLNFNEIKISVNIEEIDLYLDKYWIKFIINQILDNSIKYKANTITINAEVRDDNFVISIKDDGLGIYKEEIPYVFKKFYIGSNTKKTVLSTGVGLYLVKEVANKMNINLEIDSQVNSYTDFILYIPLKSKEKEVEEIGEILNIA